MVIYIAVTTLNYIPYDSLCGADILSSFYYCEKNKELVSRIPKMRNFMLDSGIFTMINSGKRVDIEDYLVRYAEFIKGYKIKEYVELDLDQVIGVKETRRLRDRLENMVGWQSIPVWHTIRKEDSFIDDCKNYKRICLGFFLTEGLSIATTQKFAPHFIKKAHEIGCKIHGLGFTYTSLLPKFSFDSVDSSTWSAGKRYGCLQWFDKEKKVIVQKSRPQGTKTNLPLIEKYNFSQWREYQDWALKNLYS